MLQILRKERRSLKRLARETKECVSVQKGHFLDRTTASAASIVLTNGARPCNVFFLVGSSATIGDTSRINGIVIALTSITLNNGVVDNGGFYALNAAVTMINDNVTPPGVC